MAGGDMLVMKTLDTHNFVPTETGTYRDILTDLFKKKGPDNWRV